MKHFLLVVIKCLFLINNTNEKLICLNICMYDNLYVEYYLKEPWLGKYYSFNRQSELLLQMVIVLGNV